MQGNIQHVHGVKHPFDTWHSPGHSCLPGCHIATRWPIKPHAVWKWSLDIVQSSIQEETAKRVLCRDRSELDLDQSSLQ